MSQQLSSSSELGDGIMPNAEGIVGWWKRWGRQQDFMQQTVERVTNKTLDLPDPVEINAPKITNGIGPLGLIGVALAAGIPSAILAWVLTQKPSDPPPVDTDTVWQIEDGNWK